jgi:hypothetical protein
MFTQKTSSFTSVIFIKSVIKYLKEFAEDVNEDL